MIIWFTSDMHFGHARIIELANRPFDSVDQMNQTIISNWNSVVGEDDMVFVLGDVALGTLSDSLPLVASLNGQKILISGNHDRVFGANKPAYIERFTPVYEEFFPLILDRMTLLLNGNRAVNLSHFPYDGDSHDADRYSDYRLVDSGIPLLHGHTHSSGVVSRSSQGTVQIHVGVDAHDFYPVSEQQVLDYLRLAGDL